MITKSFKNGYKKGLELDRINNNKGYSPSNCRWITHLEQQNNKRTNVLIEYNGDIHSIADWSRIIDVDYMWLYNRIKKGRKIEDILKEKRE